MTVRVNGDAENSTKLQKVKTMAAPEGEMMLSL